jgi:hypothetical protein
MKCALVKNTHYFYKDRTIPKLLVYLGNNWNLEFTDGEVQQGLVPAWINDGLIVLKKVVIDNRLNRTLYPEAKELDGYLILDEDLKTEDFWRTI